MHILISNDDGIQAPGINRLRQSLEEIAQVYVAAPDRERSATGHQITMHKPLWAKEYHYPGSNTLGWAIDGMPADCVRLALDELLPVKPDLVISGINLGPNLGTDVLYSGTVSAALEASICGYPAIAVSLASYESHDFTFAGDFMRLFVTKFCKLLPKNTLLNINIPSDERKLTPPVAKKTSPAPDAGFFGSGKAATSDATGAYSSTQLSDARKLTPPVAKKTSPAVRITRLGVREYRNVYNKRTHPRGDTYYWTAGEFYDVDGDKSDTDAWAVNNGYISITPLQYDLTDYRGLPGVASLFGDIT